MPPHAMTFSAYIVTRKPKGVMDHFQKARSPTIVDLVHGILGAGGLMVRHPTSHLASCYHRLRQSRQSRGQTSLFALDL